MLPSRIWIFSLLIACAGIAHATGPSQDTLRLDLPSGQEIQIRRFTGGDRPLLLWLPSERGIRESHQVHARALAELGHEVWLADLHEAYFIATDRSSIGRFPLDDVIAIVDAATTATAAGIILVSSQRGAQLALIAAREWQLRHPGKTDIKGALLMHAYLYEARPGIGKAAAYLPVAAATNLPVYLLDTQYSTRSAHIQALAGALAVGGSQVYTQVLQGVQGGFFARDEDELSEADRTARQNFARTLSRAAGILAMTSTPGYAAGSDHDTRRFTSASMRIPSLQRLDEPLPSPALALRDYRGAEYDLQAGRGRVRLVNFWATWCKPCVEEIPSLHRLEASIRNPAFEIVTVNVGETRERISRFLQRVPIELALLMDVDNRVAKNWNIYVYPSSYLVDQQGIIRYAYLGALEWDSPENIAIIQNLLMQR
ncbi:MAG: TlpA family protein disulfide reductase [Gammaproteobacteria bacterium]|nr:TlpA family protein disulfide reductase [Gammaproteobacteria bacterium]MDH3534628.1 TlpA family protein disulfide reductase [Gammaproteobacteria bacterium]